MSNKLIGIASDHAGFEMKEYLITWLQSQGYIIKDFGAYNSERSDYPDFGHALAIAVENGECQLGIGICGTGVGINVVMNKHQGIRAAICWRPEIARLDREHNDANILSLPGRFLSFQEGICIVKTFLTTDFEGERHVQRIEKIPIQ